MSLATHQLLEHMSLLKVSPLPPPHTKFCSSAFNWFQKCDHVTSVLPYLHWLQAPPYILELLSPYDQRPCLWQNSVIILKSWLKGDCEFAVIRTDFGTLRLRWSDVLNQCHILNYSSKHTCIKHFFILDCIAFISFRG